MFSLSVHDSWGGDSSGYARWTVHYHDDETNWQPIATGKVKKQETPEATLLEAVADIEHYVSLWCSNGMPRKVGTVRYNPSSERKPEWYEEMTIDQA